MRRSTLRLLLALCVAGRALHAQSTSSPVPAVDDPRWVPGTSNPAIARIDLVGTPSAAGDFRYLLRVPDGFRLDMHRHNTDLVAVLLTGEQRVVIQQPDGSMREHVLKPGDRLVIPKGVPHAESWHAASIVDIQGIGPMLTTTP